MQIKTTLRFHLTQSERLRSKTQGKTGAGEYVEKEEHSSTANGVASSYNHSQNQYVDSSKSGHDTTGGLHYTTPGHKAIRFPSR